MKSEIFYIFPQTISKKKFLDRFREAYRINRAPVHRTIRHYYDTFDWRLFKKQRIMVEEENCVYLQNMSNGEIEIQVDCPSVHIPHFWWEIDDESLRKYLKPMTGIRALTLMAKCQCRIQELRLLNEDEKSVLMVSLETITPMQDKKRMGSFYGIRLQSVRGYFKERRDFDRFMKNMGIGKTINDLLTKTMEASGKTPGDYSSKFRVTLRSDMSANDALRVILRYLLRIMRQNEMGIKTDIDTEFLHDFRVSVRRTRSALTQIKSIFPADVTESWKHNFAELGKSTNRLRDLDVYLLEEQAYSNMLPEALRSGLDPLFKTLQSERKQEHRRVLQYLNSKAYLDLITSWGHFLDIPTSNEEPKGARALIPIIQVARGTIYKKFKKVIRMGKEINETSPDKNLHQLRIECKKLRYLLEFFTSLFPQDEMAFLIGQLKKLQDNLGRFNDLSIQQEKLNHFLEMIDVNESHSLKIAAALGGLISRLNQEQCLERNNFKARFSAFSNPHNMALFKKLFRTVSKTGESM